MSSTVASSPARHTHFRVHTSLPVQDGDNLTSLSIHVNNNLFNDRSHNSFLQSTIAVRVVPYGLEVAGQIRKLFRRGQRSLPALYLLLDPQFDFLHFLQRVVPTAFQLIHY